jgi:hypothetical protein
VCSHMVVSHVCSCVVCVDGEEDKRVSRSLAWRSSPSCMYIANTHVSCLLEFISFRLAFVTGGLFRRVSPEAAQQFSHCADHLGCLRKAAACADYFESSPASAWSIRRRTRHLPLGALLREGHARDDNDR